MKIYQKALLCTFIGASLAAGGTAAAAGSSAYGGERHLPVFDASDTVKKKVYYTVPEEDIVKVNGNPYGLVYDGAITENIAGKVNIHPITYDVNGIQVAANVYTPADYDENKSYAAVVVAHPNGGTKEQVAGLYAQLLAEQGYITIAADASYQGASGGYPRHMDKPQYRVEDIHSMVDIISLYPGTDPERIGALGICGGGGYTLKAVQTDPRIKAAAVLSMFNSGLARKNGYGSINADPAAAQKNLAQAAAARQKEVMTGQVDYTPDLAQISEADADKLPFDLYREGYYYYGKNYAHPNSTFIYTVSSLMDLTSFDAAHNMDLIHQPLLMIAGDKADSLYMTQDAFDKATGTADKELFLVPGATHIQTYWVPEYVQMISSKLTDFFNRHLK